MTARRPRYLSLEEIVKILRGISKNEPDVGEQSNYDDMDYETLQN